MWGVVMNTLRHPADIAPCADLLQHDIDIVAALKESSTHHQLALVEAMTEESTYQVSHELGTCWAMGFMTPSMPQYMRGLGVSRAITISIVLSLIEM
jgi:hypothetical protein